jgi:hypothetical protein
MGGKKWEPDFIFLPTCLIWGVQKHRKKVE